MATQPRPGGRLVGTGMRVMAVEWRAEGVWVCVVADPELLERNAPGRSLRDTGEPQPACMTSTGPPLGPSTNGSALPGVPAQLAPARARDDERDLLPAQLTRDDIECQHL